MPLKLLVALISLCGALRAAETVVRVTDINPGGAGSFPSYLTIYNNQLYFRGNTGLQDTELWRFDGTNAARAADINVGLNGSSPSYLAALNGNLYFDASSAGVGYKLRRFDGTNISVVSVIPSAFSGSGVWNPVVWNNELWFSSSGRIYRFSGTSMSSLVNPPWANSEPVLFNNALYYSGQEASFGTELWRFNGSSQTRVSDINPGAADAYPDALFAHGGALYFRAQDATNGFELWRYNGSQAQLVADIFPGTGSSQPGGFANFRGALYFSADDGAHGYELWRYDGTNAALAANVNTNAVYEQGGDRLSDSNPRRLTVWNDALYFIAENGPITGLWRHDGTNTVLLGGGSPNGLTEMVVFQNALYFDADDGVWGRELWRVETNPVPRISIAIPAATVDLQLNQTETGRYIIEYSENLVQWFPLVTNSPVNGRILFQESPIAPHRSYRVKRLP